MDIPQKLGELSEQLKADTIDFCRRLIRVPAISGDEKGVADLYLAEMEKLGYDEVVRDEWGNVVGMIKGTEPGPLIMYNSHLDHVDPGDLSEWGGYDPYGAEMDVVEVENQDRDTVEMTEVIHGRAASDVKGGGATQIYAGAALIKLRGMGIPMKGTFMFAGVVLEEPAEQLGMIKLLDETFTARNLDYNAVVSSEATSLKLYLGHRGRVELKVTISGVTAHGSAPWLGINAVNKSTRLIDQVEEVVKTEACSDLDLGSSSIALTVINCSPGALCILPDRAYITYDRRFVPGETAESCVTQIQKVIDEISAQDPDFHAKVEIAAEPRVSYTGKTATVPNIKQAWKMRKNHPCVKAAAQALEGLGQSVKYGYWDFGTDLSVICGRDKKPAIGYSPMQEIYCHRPIDKVRVDFMVQSIAGNAAIFLKLADVPKEVFKID